MTQTIEVKADLRVSDTGDIKGIAWPWGVRDRVGDIMNAGALATPSTVPMLMNHDQSAVVGVWDEIKSTDRGLEVSGHLLVRDVERAGEVRALIKAGAMTGLSIGFRTLDAKRTREGREITAAELVEISVVAIPANPGAVVTSIKSETETPKMPEQELETKSEEKQSQTTDTTPANDAPGVDTKAFEAMQKRLDQLEAKAQRPGGVHISSPAVQVDEKKAFTTFLRSGDPTDLKTLTVGSSTAGVLAPESVSNSIIEKLAEFSPLRGVANSISMDGPLLKLPRLVDEVEPAPVAEGADKPESEPSFEEISVEPFEMGLMTPATKTLLEDAHLDLGAYLADHIARRFGEKEASWFITGDGTTQAQGVLTAPDVPDNEVAEITGDELVDHFYSIKTAYSARSVWLMNRNTMRLVRKLKDLDGQFIWQPSLADGQPSTLLGRPILESVDMPDPAAGATPIVFGDFRAGYTIADRVGFSMVRDEITGAMNGTVKFIARRRVGGRVVLPEALSKLSIAA